MQVPFCTPAAYGCHTVHPIGRDVPKGNLASRPWELDGVTCYFRPRIPESGYDAPWKLDPGRSSRLRELDMTLAFCPGVPALRDCIMLMQDHRNLTCFTWQLEELDRLLNPITIF